MILRRILRTALLCAPLVLAACVVEPTPDPTPVPTTFPVAAPEAAAELTRAYLDAWAADDYDAMHAMLDPSHCARRGRSSASPSSTPRSTG